MNTSGKLLSGGLLAGWGIFNLVEGLIDHHFIQLHNVVELAPNHDIANFLFLGLSLLILTGGYLLIRQGANNELLKN